MTKLELLKEEVLKKGYTDYQLILLVHAAIPSIASAINSEGAEAQLRFLLENGWTPEDVLGRLEGRIK